jgi:hypothetical protein
MLHHTAHTGVAEVNGAVDAVFQKISGRTEATADFNTR